MRGFNSLEYERGFFGRVREHINNFDALLKTPKSRFYTETPYKTEDSLNLPSRTDKNP